MSNIKSASMIQNIIRLSKQGVGQRGIARKLGISRNTVARYLAQEPGAPGLAPPQKADATHGAAQVESGDFLGDATHGRLDRRSLCLEHLQFILDELSLGLSGRRIFQDLCDEEGFRGSYSSVKRFLRSLGKHRKPPLPFRRLQFQPGEEMQVDYGLGAPVIINGRRRRVPVLTCVLAYSRRMYAEAMARQDTESFIRGIENAFRFFGGVTEKVCLDNLKAAVATADWYDPVLNPKIQAFADYYGTCFMPCHARMPRHKGRTESGVGHVQGNAVKGRCFDSIADENEFLRNWILRVADTRIHGTMKRQVIAMFGEEKPALHPLPPMLSPCFREVLRMVHNDGHVEVDGAYYSVPPGELRKEVWVRTDGRAVTILRDAQTPLCVHPVVPRGETHAIPGHVPAEKIWGPGNGEPCALAQVEERIGAHAREWGRYIAPFRKAAMPKVLFGLLSLLKAYTAEEIDTACSFAIQYEMHGLDGVRRLLRHSPPRQGRLQFMQEGELIRGLDFYDKAAGTMEALGQ